MKLLPKTRIGWQKAALFSISAPLVIVTVANLAAYIAHGNSKVLTRSWFLTDGVLQSIQSGPCSMIQGASAIGTIILSLGFLFVARNLSAIGFLVVVLSALVMFLTPVIIHE